MATTVRRNTNWLLVLGALVVVGLLLRAFSIDALANPPKGEANTPTQSPNQNSAEGQYRSLLGNIWPGDKVYLKSDKRLIGEIAAVKKNHTFPDGSVRDAVLIKYADGDSDWLPRETVIRIYVTKQTSKK